MKIRDKRTGEVYDLAILRANLDGGVPWASTILDALEAALSVPQSHPTITRAAISVAYHRDGWNAHAKAVSEAAGVVKERT